MTFSKQQGTVITCPNCHTQFSAKIDQILDVQQDPTAKMKLLTGQATSVQCPNCGFVLNVATPLAYHDVSKELLLIHVPMELNLSNDEQERIVGQMTRAITDSLPMEQRKGYLLNPRRTFTIQGMIEAVHEADGVTKEMLQARRQKVAFLQELLEAEDEQRDAMIEEYDADLDEEFFQMISVMIETALVNGQQQEAGYIAAVRDDLLEKTTYGQEVLASMQAQEATVQEVATALQAIGQNATRESILDLAVEFGESDDHLQVLVGFIRQAMDYEFFNILAERIDSSNSKKKRQSLRDLRDKLLSMTERFDQQRRAQIQQANAILQEMVNREDIEQVIDQYMPIINDMVIAVLEANIQAAGEQGNEELLGRLSNIYELIRQNIQRSAPRELQFINELLSMENQTEMRLKLLDEAPDYGENLLRYMDALIEDLTSRGADAIVDQLVGLREEAERVIAEG